MLLNAYAALVILGLYLNRHDRRMLLLTLAVGVSVFIPVPRHTAFAFYSFCIAAECIVLAIALILRCRASDLIANACALLVVAHVLGYSLDGSQAFSPYRSIVKMLEFTQLVACIACSSTISRILRNREQTSK